MRVIIIINDRIVVITIIIIIIITTIKIITIIKLPSNTRRKALRGSTQPYNPNQP